MNKKIKLGAAGLGLVQLTLLWGNQAIAQEAKSLNEVVVTTTKNDQKQSQTGKVVTVIDSVELSRSAGRNLSELLNQQAAINVVGAGSNIGKDKGVFFRGAAAAYTLIMIDGVPVNDASGAITTFDLRLFPVDQVERIEIIRGGQSTFHGSDAVAGVINIITKKKATKGNNVYGVATGGSYNTYKGTIGLNSRVDNFTYNVSYSHLKTDGISEAALPEGSTAIFDKDGAKQDAVNANFGIQLDPKFNINPFIRYNQSTFDYDDGAFADSKNTSLYRFLNVGTNAVYDLGETKFTLNYSHQNAFREYFGSYAGKYQGTIDLVDFYYNQKIGKKLNLLLGIDNRATDVTYYNASGTSKPSINLFSAYGSLFLHDLSVFNLEVGGRYNKHSKYGENYTYAITPSINVIEQVRLFGTISSAFRAPTLDMLFGRWGANLDLKPEKATNYEAGFNLSLLSNRIGLRVVGFKRKLTDAIVYTTGYINQDKQDDKGFEIEPNFKFGKLTFSGYYTYFKGKQVSGNTSSEILLRRPKDIYGANLGVQATDNLFFSVNYKYTGSRIDSDFSTWPSTNVALKSYQLVDFYAEYALVKKHIKLFADLKNITNEKYTEIIGYNTMGFNFNAGMSFNF
ncbi:TonB-dependent receptor plug domain-containing protein [Pedobacter montanisoli]|uniref:TonB-dependent receptor n=1 Tax=Pedobacter montanisoli TaxID=2923277 RepID=A0ABS9ZYA1_9SPHI|nr:TonB-dependent receptor [Pedobacter montanisoli]MCJ0743273.1 TonB-dependent receptor [Pedobacter montanisoli]